MEVQHIYEKSFKMYKLSIVDDNGKEISELSYSLNPVTGYTKDKDLSKFVYIELILTFITHIRKGYATKLLEKLIEMYPDKIILASANKYSRDLLLKYGVVLVNPHHCQ